MLKRFWNNANFRWIFLTLTDFNFSDLHNWSVFTGHLLSLTAKQFYGWADFDEFVHARVCAAGRLQKDDRFGIIPKKSLARITVTNMFNHHSLVSPRERRGQNVRVKVQSQGQSEWRNIPNRPVSFPYLDWLCCLDEEVSLPLKGSIWSRAGSQQSVTTSGHSGPWE